MTTKKLQNQVKKQPGKAAPKYTEIAEVGGKENSIKKKQRRVAEMRLEQ